MQYNKKKDPSIGSYGQRNSHYILIRSTPDTLGPGSFTPNYFFTKPSIKTSTFSLSGRFLILNNNQKYLINNSQADHILLFDN